MVPISISLSAHIKETEKGKCVAVLSRERKEFVGELVDLLGLLVVIRKILLSDKMNHRKQMNATNALATTLPDNNVKPPTNELESEVGGWVNVWVCEKLVLSGVPQ